MMKVPLNIIYCESKKIFYFLCSGNSCNNSIIILVKLTIDWDPTIGEQKDEQQIAPIVDVTAINLDDQMPAIDYYSGLPMDPYGHSNYMM